MTMDNFESPHFDSTPPATALGPAPAFAAEPPPAPWTLRDLFFFLAFSLAALLIAQFVTLAVYFALKPLAGWHASVASLAQNPFFLLAFQALFYLLLLGYVFLLVVTHYHLPFLQGIRWRVPAPGSALGYLAAGVALAIAVQFAPTVLPDKDQFPLQQLFSSAASSYAVGAFAILIAPFMEELIFRCVFFNVLETRVSRGFAIFMTALLFAALHVPEYWGAWNHVMLIFLVGMVFSLARGVTGSLAPSVLLHGAYNASLIVGIFIATQHFKHLEGLLALAAHTVAGV